MDANQIRKRTKQGKENAKRWSAEDHKRRRAREREAYNAGAKHGQEKAYKACQKEIESAANQGRAMATYCISTFAEGREYTIPWVHGAADAVAKKLRAKGFTVFQGGAQYDPIDPYGPPLTSETLEISWKK